MKQVSTFLMFDGRAEEAVNFYVHLFQDAELDKLTRYQGGEAGPEGKVKQGSFRLKDQHFMAFDSPIKHEFGFTPAMSIFVDCDSREEVERLATGLGEGGDVLMPLDAYDFAVRFSWIQDRFGVSWQLCYERS